MSKQAMIDMHTCIALSAAFRADAVKAYYVEDYATAYHYHLFALAFSDDADKEFKKLTDEEWEQYQNLRDWRLHDVIA